MDVSKNTGAGGLRCFWQCLNISRFFCRMAPLRQVWPGFSTPCTENMMWQKGSLAITSRKTKYFWFLNYKKYLFIICSIVLHHFRSSSKKFNDCTWFIETMKSVDKMNQHTIIKTFFCKSYLLSSWIRAIVTQQLF